MVKVTARSGRALFYRKQASLKHKVLALEEGEGMAEANYAIRNVVSACSLVIEWARRLLESYLKAVRPFLLRQVDEHARFLNHAGQRMPYHTFRRGCTTELIRGGANLYHVKEQLGHENLETLKHYTKLTIQDLKATHARCHPRERAGET